MRDTTQSYGGTSLGAPRAFRMTGAILLLATGLIHLIDAPEHYEEATYVGLLFSADLLGALLAAFGIYKDALWGWLLGLVVAGGAFILYLISRLIGLPGYEVHVGEWSEPLGIISTIIEPGFVVLFLLAVMIARRPTVSSADQVVSRDASKRFSLSREKVRLVLIVLATALVLVGHVVHLVLSAGS